MASAAWTASANRERRRFLAAWSAPLCEGRSFSVMLVWQSCEAAIGQGGDLLVLCEGASAFVKSRTDSSSFLVKKEPKRQGDGARSVQGARLFISCGGKTDKSLYIINILQYFIALYKTKACSDDRFGEKMTRYFRNWE